MGANEKWADGAQAHQGISSHIWRELNCAAAWILAWVACDSKYSISCFLFRDLCELSSPCTTNCNWAQAFCPSTWSQHGVHVIVHCSHNLNSDSVILYSRSSRFNCNGSDRQTLSSPLLIWPFIQSVCKCTVYMIATWADQKCCKSVHVHNDNKENKENDYIVLTSSSAWAGLVHKTELREQKVSVTDKTCTS